MSGIITFTLAVVAIALGYALQSKNSKTGGYAVGAMLATGVLFLLTPTVFGLPSIWLFGVAFAFAFGCNIVYKAKMRAWARSQRRSL